MARNVALGFLHGQWARFGCLGLFEEGAVRRDISPAQGACKVVIIRPAGDLQVIIDRNLDVLQGLMRQRDGTAWQPLTAQFCSYTSRVGLQELRGARLLQREVDFAFKAVIAERIRMEAIGKGCGTSLALQSSNATVKHLSVQTLQRASEHRFALQVSKEGNSDTPIRVEVRLMKKTYWQGDDATSESVFSFIRSFPEPCQIFAGRALQAAPDGVEAAVDEELPPPRELREATGRYVSNHLEFLQLNSIPDEYDFRRYHGGCLRPAWAQGVCGSSWAFAAVGAFEKQLCRLSDGAVAGPLSRQWALSCAVDSGGCDGGSLQSVHAVFLRRGAVPEKCATYFSGATHAPMGAPIGDTYCNEDAVKDCGTKRFFARYPNAYEVRQQLEGMPLGNLGGPSPHATRWLTGERGIRVAILSFGAVVSRLSVYADFLAYQTGVYRRQSTDFQGVAAVQILGWGVEPSLGEPFWVCEGNWGPKWGENQRFKACTVQDCRGEFCARDNGNPDCFDSTTWVDESGYNCAWYTKNDPGCRLYKDTGQMARCPKSCKTCDAPALPDGEVCGFFRIRRGDNHCGIEELAAHAYAAMYSPSSEAGVRGPDTACADRAQWNDAYGRGCAWYKGKGCGGLPDVGQLSNCQATCGTCGQRSRTARPTKGWAMNLLPNQAARPVPLHLYLALVAWFVLASRRP